MLAVRSDVRAFARFLAALCAAALLFGDVARGVHLLVAHHVVCAAHGELVEVDEAPEAPAARGDDGSPAAAPAPGVDEHDHCSIAAAPSRFSAVDVSATAVVSTDLARGCEIASPELPFGHRSPAISYAPKQGPPV